MALSSKELFKKRASALKKAGISNFDLRRNPTNYEKRKARELYNKFLPVIQYPEQYEKRQVSAKTARAIDFDAGKIKNKSGKYTVFVFNEGGKKVKFNRDHSITVGEEGKDKYTRRVYPGGKDIFKTAEKLIKKFNKNNLPPDDEEDYEDPSVLENYYKEYLMVNIGNSADFSKSVAWTPDMFNNYLNNWEPKDAKNLSAQKKEEIKQHLISRMNVVKIYNPAGFFGNGQPKQVKRKKPRRRN